MKPWKYSSNKYFPLILSDHQILKRKTIFKTACVVYLPQFSLDLLIEQRCTLFQKQFIFIVDKKHSIVYYKQNMSND